MDKVEVVVQENWRAGEAYQVTILSGNVTNATVLRKISETCLRWGRVVRPLGSGEYGLTWEVVVASQDCQHHHRFHTERVSGEELAVILEAAEAQERYFTLSPRDMRIRSDLQNWMVSRDRQLARPTPGEPGKAVHRRHKPSQESGPY